MQLGVRLPEKQQASRDISFAPLGSAGEHCQPFGSIEISFAPLVSAGLDCQPLGLLMSALHPLGLLVCMVSRSARERSALHPWVCWSALSAVRLIEIRLATPR